MRLAGAAIALGVTFALLQCVALLRLAALPDDLQAARWAENGGGARGARGGPGKTEWIHGEIPGGGAAEDPLMGLEGVERFDECVISPQPRQIFYNRIGKAGSSSLLTWIATMIAEDDDTNYHRNDDTASERFTLEEETAFTRRFQGLYRSGERNVIEKHTYWVDFHRNGISDPPSYINMMRDPAQRWLSQYHFWRTLQGVFGREVRELGYSVEDCLRLTKQDTTYTCPMANYQTLYLCGHDPDVCTSPVTEATYKRALHNLVMEYDIVGPLEALDMYRLLLARMYPSYFDEARIRPALPHAKNSGRKDEATEEQLRLARELNKYDYKLYDVAVRLFRRKALACGIPPDDVAAAAADVPP